MMLHRVGISIDDQDLKGIKLLQQQFRIKNRSEFFRELVKRYEKLSKEFKSLRDCLTGYINHPESATESKSILKTTLKNIATENW